MIAHNLAKPEWSQALMMSDVMRMALNLSDWSQEDLLKRMRTNDFLSLEGVGRSAAYRLG